MTGEEISVGESLQALVGSTVLCDSVLKVGLETGACCISGASELLVLGLCLSDRAAYRAVFIAGRETSGTVFLESVAGTATSSWLRWLKLGIDIFT